MWPIVSVPEASILGLQTCITEYRERFGKEPAVILAAPDVERSFLQDVRSLRMYMPTEGEHLTRFGNVRFRAKNTVPAGTFYLMADDPDEATA